MYNVYGNMAYFFSDNPLADNVPVVATKIVVPDANKLSAKYKGMKREGFYYSNTGDNPTMLGIGYAPTDTKGILIAAGASYPLDVSEDVDIYHKAKGGLATTFSFQEYK